VYFLNSLGQLLSKYVTKYFVSSVRTSFDGTYTVGGSYDNNIYFFERTQTPPPKPQFPKITALKTIMSSTLAEGDTTTVEIIIQNIGDEVAKNISLMDSISLGFELVEGETNWTGELAPQDAETLSYKIKALKVPDNKETTYQLPGVNITYEDLKGMVYTSKGAPILITVTPKISKPSERGADIKEMISVIMGEARKMSSPTVTWGVPLIILSLLALFLTVRRRRLKVRREKVEMLKHIKEEIGPGMRSRRPLFKRKKPSPLKSVFSAFDLGFGYKKYREETLNLIKGIKAGLKGRKFPSGTGTFPRPPRRAFYHSPIYWVKSFRSGSENRAYREGNVNLLTDIKKAVGG
jgi:uncharacterized repeat protein (TIGR01451 family)